jgi:UDP-N-acetylmuramyl pentapeptide phosphotransferase/UDP-N-acetylglucosamine-1-phosphate transferase
MGPVKGATIVATIVPVLVLGIPIFDTAFAILRRLVNRRPIMEADKGHLHHRMMAVGLGQRRTVLMIYGISAVMGIAAILYSRDLFLETVGLVIVAATFIYIYITDYTNQPLTIDAVDIAAEEKLQQKAGKE